MTDIDSLLAEWARWVASGRPQLGYSDRTLVYEMVKSGIIAHGQGLKREPDAIDEQQTDAAMQRLREAKPREYEAVALQYLGKGQPWQKAKDMSISEAQYFKLVKLGRYWLEGHFEAVAA